MRPCHDNTLKAALLEQALDATPDQPSPSGDVAEHLKTCASCRELWDATTDFIDGDLTPAPAWRHPARTAPNLNPDLDLDLRPGRHTPSLAPPPRPHTPRRAITALAVCIAVILAVLVGVWLTAPEQLDPDPRDTTPAPYANDGTPAPDKTPSTSSAPVAPAAPGPIHGPALPPEPEPELPFKLPLKPPSTPTDATSPTRPTPRHRGDSSWGSDSMGDFSPTVFGSGRPSRGSKTGLPTPKGAGKRPARVPARGTSGP